MVTKHIYLSDLHEREWQKIKYLLPKAWDVGRPRSHRVREILNAIFYVLRSGCSWRMRPSDYAPWQTACGYFRRWSGGGTLLSASTGGCARPCARHRAPPGAPRRRCSTARACARPTRPACAATMPARRSKDANATCGQAGGMGQSPAAFRQAAPGHRAPQRQGRRFPTSAQAMDGRAHLWLAGQIPPPPPRL